MHLEFLVERPIANGEQWLIAVRKWRLEQIVPIEQLDLALARWCWDFAEACGEPVVGFGWRAVEKWTDRLIWAKREVRRKFPREMEGAEVEWKFEVGRPGSIWIKRNEVGKRIELAKNQFEKMNRSAQLLLTIKQQQGNRVLKCTRGSGRAAVIKQRKKGERSFACSAEGGGLVLHEPFLKALVKGKVGTLVMPDKNRLGRSSWLGVKNVLGAAGVQVVLKAGDGGVDALGRTNRKRRLLSKLAGAVVVPGWLGVGERVGRVRVLAGEAALAVRCGWVVGPADDQREEHWVLKWALEGVRAPRRIGGFCSGKSGRVREERVVN